MGNCCKTRWPNAKHHIGAVRPTFPLTVGHACQLLSRRVKARAYGTRAIFPAPTQERCEFYAGN